MIGLHLSTVCLLRTC